MFQFICSKPSFINDENPYSQLSSINTTNVIQPSAPFFENEMRQDPNYYIELKEEIRMMNEKINASASSEFSMFAQFKMGMSYRIDAGNFCVIDQDQKYSTKTSDNFI